MLNDDHSIIIKFINEHINFLVEQKLSKKQQKKYKKDISDLRSDIENIKLGIRDLNNPVKDKNFPYSFCEIVFKDEYKIPIHKYGLDEVYRTLKGRMFFSIINGSLKNNFIDLQTNSLKNTNFKIRLKGFYNFNTFVSQKGDALLIYKNKYKGEETEIFFEFKKLN
jgi:hypothetical protein